MSASKQIKLKGDALNKPHTESQVAHMRGKCKSWCEHRVGEGEEEVTSARTFAGVCKSQCSTAAWPLRFTGTGRCFKKTSREVDAQKFHTQVRG